MPNEMIIQMKALNNNLGRYSEPFPGNKEIINDITECCDYLSSLQTELPDSVGWFRLPFNMQDRANIGSCGSLAAYMIKYCAKPDPILVASYLKPRIESIQYGLIPAEVRSVLKTLLKPFGKCMDIPAETRQFVVDLLAICPLKFQILCKIFKLAQLILEYGVVENGRMLPSALATIIKVSGGSEFSELTNYESAKIEISEWNIVWGMILEMNISILES